MSDLLRQYEHSREHEIAQAYCPCSGVCHHSKYPCSLSCIAASPESEGLDALRTALKEWDVTYSEVDRDVYVSAAIQLADAVRAVFKLRERQP